MDNTNGKKLRCPVWSSVHKKGEGKMYGILLESAQYYVRKDVGEDMWQKILIHAGLKNISFSTHTTYKDDIMIQLAKSCCHVTKTKSFNEWMIFFGTCFVDFCSSYGYDKLLRVAGRHYRDFLHGIDNIHEVIRFSYPRLQSPSFIVLSEDVEGCVLLYRSKRHSFKYYVVGQLQQCARKFYGVSVKVTLIDEDSKDGLCSVKFRLDFDNSVYLNTVNTVNISGKRLFNSISGDTFFKVFPFCIVFNSQMIIKHVGKSLSALLKSVNIIGSNLRDEFRIRRPLIPCIWSKILQFQRVIFELEYTFSHEESDLDLDPNSGLHRSLYSETTSGTQKSWDERILLRGEMKYLKEWDMIAFLSTPLINDLNNLQKIGLYINDLNMYDMSRDMVLAGWQHSSKLERSIEQQREKSDKITETMMKAEEWKNISDNLLYSMIPKCIAERLKAGENPIDTCEVFDNVTIMFNYMVGFADICATATPMEIVKCINCYFILFDNIVDKYDVFKVETLGDPVYMVAGGVPDRNPDHAINVAGLALELQAEAKKLMDPFGKDHLKTRIGMHTGSTVGGVVGKRMPQYCLFGDTVNTASRMQTYSQPGRIHLSEPCNQCLKNSGFVTLLRGKVNIKGKGEMQTYWLAGKEGEESTQQMIDEVRKERSDALLKLSSQENVLDLHRMHACTSEQQIFGGLLPAMKDGSTNRLSRGSGSSLLNSPKFNEHYNLDFDSGIVLTIQPDKDNSSCEDIFDIEDICILDEEATDVDETSQSVGGRDSRKNTNTDMSECTATGVNSETSFKTLISTCDEIVTDGRKMSDNETVNKKINKQQVEPLMSFQIDDFILKDGEQDLNTNKKQTGARTHEIPKTTNSYHGNASSQGDERSPPSRSSVELRNHLTERRDSSFSLSQDHDMCPFFSCLSAARDDLGRRMSHEEGVPVVRNDPGKKMSHGEGVSTARDDLQDMSHEIGVSAAGEDLAQGMSHKGGKSVARDDLRKKMSHKEEVLVVRDEPRRMSHKGVVSAVNVEKIDDIDVACKTDVITTSTQPTKLSNTKTILAENGPQSCPIRTLSASNRVNPSKTVETCGKILQEKETIKTNTMSTVVSKANHRNTNTLEVTADVNIESKPVNPISSVRELNVHDTRRKQNYVQDEGKGICQNMETKNKHNEEMFKGHEEMDKKITHSQRDRSFSDGSPRKMVNYDNSEKWTEISTNKAVDVPYVNKVSIELVDNSPTMPLVRHRLCSVPELKTYEELIGSMKEHQSALAAASSSQFGVKRIQTSNIPLEWCETNNVANGDIHGEKFKQHFPPFQSSSFDSRMGYLKGVYKRAHSLLSDSFITETDSADRDITTDTSSESQISDKSVHREASTCSQEAIEEMAKLTHAVTSMNGDCSEDKREEVIFGLPET